MRPEAFREPPAGGGACGRRRRLPVGEDPGALAQIRAPIRPHPAAKGRVVGFRDKGWVLPQGGGAWDGALRRGGASAGEFTVHSPRISAKEQSAESCSPAATEIRRNTEIDGNAAVPYGRLQAPSVSLLQFQAPAVLGSNAACFSPQEWENLEEWQREPHQNALRGRSESLISLGKDRWVSPTPRPAGLAAGGGSRRLPVGRAEGALCCGRRSRFLPVDVGRAFRCGTGAMVPPFLDRLCHLQT